MTYLKIRQMSPSQIDHANFVPKTSNHQDF
jgi:hypothetical protein